MPSNAKVLFDGHIEECKEAIALYDHLEGALRFRASFSLRFVWIAAVSALDHYVSQLILERAIYAYGNNLPLQGKLLADLMTFSNAMTFRNADPVQSVIVFRGILDGCIRYKSFQSPEKISDGLSYVWSERHKWQYISNQLGVEQETIKRKLSGIVDRRNLIAHSGDFDEGLGAKLPVERDDAVEVVSFIESLVNVIDAAVSV